MRKEYKEGCLTLGKSYKLCIYQEKNEPSSENFGRNDQRLEEGSGLSGTSNKPVVRNFRGHRACIEKSLL